MWYGMGMKIANAEFGMEKFRKYVVRFVLHLLLFPVRFFSYVVPRDKNLWVFGMPKKFDGNSKYLFLHLQNSKESDVKSVWVSQNRELINELQKRGFSACSPLSLQGFYYSVRGGYFFVDTSVEVISYWLSGGAKVFNLFHALPIKKMERDVTKGESTEVKLFYSTGIIKLFMHFFLPWRFVKPSYVSSPSPLYTKIFMSMFGVEKEQVPELGCPRTDILLHDIEGSEVGLDTKSFEEIKERRDKGTKIVIYAPTFRDTGDTSFLENEAQVEKLNDLMKMHNTLFVLKLHPFMKVKVTEGQYSNILHALAPTDSYPLLKLSDILVTDYSSIFVDFLLLDRPQIFFAPDLEKYVTRDRELYFDYKEFTPGEKAYTFEEFLHALEKVLRGEDEYAAKRKEMKSRCFVDTDGQSAARIVSFAKKISS